LHRGECISVILCTQVLLPQIEFPVKLHHATGSR
jgi:hypothetical protein